MYGEIETKPTITKKQTQEIKESIINKPTTTQPTQKEETWDVNVTLNSWELSYYFNEEMASYDEGVLDEFMDVFKPQEGYVYYIMDITVESNIDLNGISFKMKDTEGYTYTENVIAIGYIKDYLPSELNANDIIRGKRVLEIRIGMEPKQMIMEAYDNNYERRRVIIE